MSGKELRKNQYLTAKELADKLHIDTIDVLNMDDKRLKDIEEPLKSEMIPILRGDYMDRLPN
ncbi:transcriptional regulator [Desulfitobacterium sp. THU1]|uniref:transcriptional regulator n=1 Tax=Desulfitobacterium sp. THU1 TaxID=3138072 RepID=UPI00311D7B22